MSMPLRLLPTDELVTVAWIGSIPGLSLQMVATQLPEPLTKHGQPADWVARGRGFVTVAVAGGGPDPNLPISRPVMQVDCWAVEHGSNKPPWGIANRLAETIRLAALDRVGSHRTVAITVRGVDYPPAAVTEAAVRTAPRRTYGDVGDYACYQMDLELAWQVPGLQVR